MPDIYDHKKRSEIMSRVRDRDTKPENRVRQIAHSLGYRFRLYRNDLPGKPDLVFPRHGKVIFVHGCFWHGHKNCRKAKRPATNSVFWDQKLSRNMERDRENIIALKQVGWESLIIWECETRDREHIEQKIRRFFEGQFVEEG